MILNMHRTGAYTVATNSDQVIMGVPIPPGGRLLTVQGSVHVNTTARIALEAIVMYGLKGYVMPVFDPDTPQTYDALWDALVEKDQPGTSQLDIDTSAGDTEPDTELGQLDMQQVLGINATELIEVFKRERFITFASHPMHAHLDTTHFYHPGERFSLKITRPVAVEQPAMFLLALSSPDMGTTTTSLRSTPSEKDWAQLVYIEDLVSDMVKNAIGLVEAGAETPYVEAQALIASLLEDTAIEESARAADFLATSWDVLIDATAQVEMNQPSANRQLSGG